MSVDNADMEGYDFELGNKKKYAIRTWYIEIFAINKSQRDDLLYQIWQEIDNNIPVYDYDEGFPVIGTPTQLGSLTVESKRSEVIRVSPSLVDLLHFRAVIEITAIYNKI